MSRLRRKSLYVLAGVAPKFFQTLHLDNKSGIPCVKSLVLSKDVRSVLPRTKTKITWLLVGGPNSSFQLKVKFTFKLKINVIEYARRMEKNRIHITWKLVLVDCVFLKFTADATI